VSDEPLDYLTTEDLLEIAAGAIGDGAIREDGLVVSAGGRPRTRAFGDDASPTLAGRRPR
jgi:hypothetical protein